MDVKPTKGADQLRQYIERIERLEEEKALMSDIKDIFPRPKPVALTRKPCGKLFVFVPWMRKC